MLVNSLIFVASLIALLWAADVFVDRVVDLARRLEVSTMVIGLTVVAIGTSLPELAASTAAALDGYPGIALGNVIGSNICNVALILGVPPLFFGAISCQRRVLRREGYLMLACTGALWVVVGLCGYLSRPVGIIFLLGFVAFVYWVFETSRKDKLTGLSTSPDELEDIVEEALHPTLSAEEAAEEMAAGQKASWQVLGTWLLISLVTILLSSEFLVKSTVELAVTLGISETVIALSLIAFGTSVPELSVSIAAARKNEGDIAVGNVLGSNVSNILLVLGMTASIRPFAISSTVLIFDFPLMALTSVLMLVFLRQEGGITRSRGIWLLLLYVALIVRCFLYPS